MSKDTIRVHADTRGISQSCRTIDAPSGAFNLRTMLSGLEVTSPTLTDRVGPGTNGYFMCFVSGFYFLQDQCADRGDCYQAFAGASIPLDRF